MSLELAAQHLASRGRGPDTQLVHMAPQEVAGLQSLARAAGGTLTTNPDTGLPEAGFLKNLLPTLIGAGLSVASGGTLTPLMAAMMTGAGYGAVTGDLKKGLMAGLGAYGGAGLGAGLNAAAGTVGQGATALTAPVEGLATVGGQSVGQAANAIGGNLGSSLAGLDTGVSQALQATGAAAPAAQAAQAASQAMPAGFEVFNATPTNFGAFGEAPLQAAVTPPIDSSFSANYAVGPKALRVAPVTPEPSALARAQSGLQALGTQRGRDAFIGNAASKGVEATGVGGYAGLARSGLSALGPALMTTEPPAPPKGSGPNPYRYRFEQEFPEGPNADGSAEALQYRGSYVPYAAGGPIEEMSQKNEALTLMADGGQQFARGGISHLGDYSDGGRLLRGPGDGVSDSIPATIANKRPARLADGEFVVPARIVSELGNGSTEAGARKLYAMMDRVQNARKKSIGKKKVAVNSRADKALPA